VLTDPEQTYALGEGEWVVHVREQGLRRRNILVEYKGQPREELYDILARNVRDLGQHIRQERLDDLRTVRGKGGTELSAKQVHDQWKSDYLLGMFFGIVNRSAEGGVGRSQIYLGDLAQEERRSFALKLKFSNEGLGQDIDNHSLALVYALALEAKAAGATENVLYEYLHEAETRCQNIKEAGDDLDRLKRSIRETFASWGLHLQTGFCL